MTITYDKRGAKTMQAKGTARTVARIRATMTGKRSFWAFIWEALKG